MHARCPKSVALLLYSIATLLNLGASVSFAFVIKNWQLSLKMNVWQFCSRDQLIRF